MGTLRNCFHKFTIFRSDGMHHEWSRVSSMTERSCVNLTEDTQKLLSVEEIFLFNQPEVTLPVNVVWNSLHMILVVFLTDVWSFDISVIILKPFCVTGQYWNPQLCTPLEMPSFTEIRPVASHIIVLLGFMDQFFYYCPRRNSHIRMRQSVHWGRRGASQQFNKSFLFFLCIVVSRSALHAAG